MAAAGSQTPLPSRAPAPPRQRIARAWVGRAGTIPWLSLAGWLALLALALISGTRERSGATVSPAPSAAETAIAASAPPDHACRLWGMIGTAPDPAAVTVQLLTGTPSLRSLAASNPDGWGVAYFSATLAGVGLDRPEILRGGPPAHSPHDDRFASAVTEMLGLDATCAVAHVRAATTGHAGVPDPHPFCTREFAFAHNGTVSSAALTAMLTLEDPQYLTTHPLDYESPQLDSELYWLYVRKLREEGVSRRDGRRSFGTADAVAEAALRMHLEGAILSAANCLIAQRDTLYALRFDNNASERYRLRYKQISGAWTVASEPLGADTTGWSSLPPRSLGVFTAAAPPQIRTVYPPPGAYVIVHAFVADDSLGGNDDGGLDAGETIHVRVELENIGGETAPGVSAVLRSSSPHAAVKDSLALYGDIPSQQTQPGLEGDHFVLQIAGDCPDQEALLLELEIRASGDDDWAEHFAYTVDAPALAMALAEIDDSAGGDGDGVLEPGEAASLSIVISNTGHSPASGILATLTSLSDTLSVTQPTAAADTIAAGGSVALAPAFGVSLALEALSPGVMPCALALSGDWDLSLSLGFNVPVGGFRDDMESGEGAWTHGVVTPGFTDQWHWSGYRNHTTGGSHSWKFGGANAAAYADSSDGALVTPPIEVLQFTTLAFWHWIDAEAVIGGQNDAYDGGLVEMSLNGGPWQQIEPDDGYPYRIRASLYPGPFPAGTPVFSGAHNWSQETFSLETLGGEMRLRFRFGSNGTVHKEGWYIDDVAVTSYTNASAVEAWTAPPRAGLGRVSPNPIGSNAEILFTLPGARSVRLHILDLEGRVVRTLADGPALAGEHRIRWDGRDESGRPLGSGVYFCRLKAGDAVETRKLTLAR